MNVSGRRRLHAFTDTFEDLPGLVQLPGIPVQRLIAYGYEFGAERDWKTAAAMNSILLLGHCWPPFCLWLGAWRHSAVIRASGASLTVMSKGGQRNRARNGMQALLLFRMNVFSAYLRTSRRPSSISYQRTYSQTVSFSRFSPFIMISRN